MGCVDEVEGGGGVRGEEGWVGGGGEEGGPRPGGGKSGAWKSVFFFVFFPCVRICCSCRSNFIRRLKIVSRFSPAVAVATFFFLWADSEKKIC